MKAPSVHGQPCCRLGFRIQDLAETLPNSGEAECLDGLRTPLPRVWRQPQDRLRAGMADFESRSRRLRPVGRESRAQGCRMPSYEFHGTVQTEARRCRTWSASPGGLEAARRRQHEKWESAPLCLCPTLCCLSGCKMAITGNAAADCANFASQPTSAGNLARVGTRSARAPPEAGQILCLKASSAASYGSSLQAPLVSVHPRMAVRQGNLMP